MAERWFQFKEKSLEITVKYLLDSDWFINCLEDNGDYGKMLRRMRCEGIAVSNFTLAEVLTGIVGEENEEKRRKVFVKFLEPLTILSFDYPVVEKFAQIHKRLLKKHTPLENFDIAIAATAIAHDLTLLTDNRSHFERIEGLKIYENS